MAAEPGSWDLLDEDCANISDWNDIDSGNGVSEVSPAGQFRMDANAAAAGTYAARSRDIGVYPNIWTLEIKLYCDKLGSGLEPNPDVFRMQLEHDDVRLWVSLGSDGLKVYDGSSWNEVGTDVVLHGGSAAWQTWRFVVDFTTAASAVCNIYLDGTKIATGVDCSNTGSFTDGLTQFLQFGYTVEDCLTHIDYIKAATGAFPSFRGLPQAIFME